MLTIYTYFISYTDEYKRFLSLALHVDPDMRASVDDLLNDPFIKKHNLPDISENEVNLSQRQPRLEKMVKTVSRPLSLTNVQDFMNKLVHK